MCRIDSQVKGFRVLGVKFWETAVVIGWKLYKRFGFSVSIKSAVIEVKGVCHCDLGMSPAPTHLRSLSGCVTVVRGGSLREAMSPKPRGGREGELGLGGRVGLCLFSSFSTVPRTRKRPSSQVMGRDRLSECPPSAIRKEGLLEAFKIPELRPEPKARAFRAEELVMTLSFLQDVNIRVSNWRWGRKSSKCTQVLSKFSDAATCFFEQFYLKTK